MNVTLRQLRVLLSIAQLQSFTRTADSIGLTQSAVSHSVRELEAELGLKLLDRTTREVQLTDAGKRLVAALGPLLEDLDRTLQSAHSTAEQLQGKVRVAASPTISAHLMPHCIAACKQAYPDINLILHDKVQRMVVESVEQGEVDFGVMVASASADNLLCEPILEEPFYVVCRNDHPFATARTMRWSKLNGEDLVLLDHASGSRQVIDDALTSLGIRCNVVQELGHPTTVFQMVAAGIGVGILPLLSMPATDTSGLAVRLLSPKMNRTLILARRKNRSLSPGAQKVWELIAETARQKKQSPQD